MDPKFYRCTLILSWGGSAVAVVVLWWIYK